MTSRTACLAAVTDLVTRGQTDQFKGAITAAYAAGARHSDLLTAVDIARTLTPVPPRALTVAYRVVNDLSWMAAWRAVPQREVMA